MSKNRPRQMQTMRMTLCEKSKYEMLCAHRFFRSQNRTIVQLLLARMKDDKGDKQRVERWIIERN